MAKKKLIETTKLLLWVNDNLAMDESRYQGFLSNGVSVVCAATTGKAIELFGRAQYDAIITDLRRQEYGQKNDNAGIELTQQIRRTNGHIPIFIYTINLDSLIVDLAKRSGATLITANPAEFDNTLRQHQLIP